MSLDHINPEQLRPEFKDGVQSLIQLIFQKVRRVSPHGCLLQQSSAHDKCRLGAWCVSTLRCQAWLSSNVGAGVHEITKPVAN